MRSGSEEGSHLRLVDVCITRLKAESNTEEEEKCGLVGDGRWGRGLGVERACE